MKILLFGKLGDRVGREIEIEHNFGCTVAQLRATLASRYPDAASELASSRVRVCVDQEIVHEEHRLIPGQEIAFIPPLSGG
jgi:sulfur-carrier protein